MSETPRIQKVEITLYINTGNVIYQEFDDIESAMRFIQYMAHNPKAILERIAPWEIPDHDEEVLGKQ